MAARSSFISYLTAFLGLATPVAWAEIQPLAPRRQGLRQSERLTGTWSGRRTALLDRGIDLSLYSNTYFGLNLRGGVDTNNAHRFSTSYDLILHLDFTKMNGIEGGELLIFSQGFSGRNINPKVGAIADPIDDADGDTCWYIDQLWYQQSLFDRTLQFRLGYLDQQSILDRNAYANSEDKQFMNTYLDNDNAIVPLTIGLGASMFYQPTNWLGFVLGAADGEGRQFRAGFDTAFHGGADFFGYFETDIKLRFESANGTLPGTYRVGVLYDPRLKTRYVRRRQGDDRPLPSQTGDYGFYLSCDQLLYRESSADLQGLGVFARYGFRHDDVNRINQFWSTGFQYEGLIPQRDQDVLGLGAYAVHASDLYQEYVDMDFSRETGFEFYYRIQLTPWLMLTPDFQYIIQPGGNRDAKDSIVFALRLRVTI